jgi:hypothetical protein
MHDDMQAVVQGKFLEFDLVLGPRGKRKYADQKAQEGSFFHDKKIG